MCEVQSDKASVEITSRFAGVVKRLHYEAGEMAKVGKPLVDIDIQGDAKKTDLETLTSPVPEPTPVTTRSGKTTDDSGSFSSLRSEHTEATAAKPGGNGETETATPQPNKGKHASLATPAVRHLSKELHVDISQVSGTGREGRVSKEDIYKFVEQKDGAAATPSTPHTSASVPGQQQETRMPLTKTQEHMFKTMTRSLNIPHFLYHPLTPQWQ